MQLPLDFLHRLERIIPEENLPSVLDSYQHPKPIGCRINTLKIDIDDAYQALSDHHFTPSQAPISQSAFTLPHIEREKLINHPLFQTGIIYIQSLSSQIPPLVLAPRPHEEVLDLTAAPGSKTTQIAALMQNTGRLAAVEKSKNRFYKLKANCDNLGVTNAVFYWKDGTTVGRACKERFDRILLDAPCSAEGRFDTSDEKSITHWSLSKVKALAKKQWPLLLSAWQALKPGGTLVYATCTLAPEENELVLAKLLTRFPTQAHIQPISLQSKLDATQNGLTSWKNKTLPDALSHTLRILPSEIMDGFYIGLIHKK